MNTSEVHSSHVGVSGDTVQNKGSVSGTKDEGQRAVRRWLPQILAEAQGGESVLAVGVSPQLGVLTEPLSGDTLPPCRR